MLETILKDAQAKMDRAIAVVEEELKALRTGRSSINMVDGITAHVYGADTPLNQLATISTPDASTVQVQPWDVSALAAIEKALLQANLGMTPNNDGKVIRLNVPQLTQDTRKELVKRSHHIAEEGRVAVRNVRRHVNDEIKKQEKELNLSEDDKKRKLDEVQKKTDAHIKKIDELTAAKEKEIMTI